MTFYRRNLPHWHPDGKAIFLTWRLYGSLPRKVQMEIAMSHSDPGERFRVLDRRLDSATSGPVWLCDPEIAAYAEYPILRGAELGRYDLYAYVIMPNHVHLVAVPKEQQVLHFGEPRRFLVDRRPILAVRRRLRHRLLQLGVRALQKQIHELAVVDDRLGTCGSRVLGSQLRLWRLRGL